MNKVFSLVVAAVLTIIPVGSAYAHETGVAHEHPSASPTAAPAEFNSFEEFWPVVAGRVEGDSLYFVKMLKERVREKLLLTSFKKADYNIGLSVKRTVEAEALIRSGKIDNARKTLEKAHEKRVKALSYITKAKEEGEKVDDLKYTLKATLEKELALLTSLAQKESGDAKALIEDSVAKVSSMISSL